MKLTCSNLTKSFSGREVVKGVDLTITPGKVLGLLGPNGAGKSTTINMLTGQLKPDSGTISIDGQEFSAFPVERRHEIGLMPQEIIIWNDLTIKENLEYSASLFKLSKDLTKARVQELIDGLQLAPEINTLAKNLSGGYKRRLNLAISVIHNPSVVFLDEPSPGIDAQSRLLLTTYIERLAKEEGKAVVLTDHYLDEAEKLSDYVVIVDGGEVVTEGTVQQLKNKYGKGNIIQIHLDPEKCSELLAAPDSMLAMFEKDFETPAIAKETITMLTDNPGKGIQKALKIVENNNLEILTINIKESTLEDIFLLITGKDVRE